ncbi:MAG TPA: hypothetical protein PLE45_02335 [Spirochaetota bacterium]|nr:hypothetical protein [Spirochaetota bacterium]HOL56706.1 hypothetical protein [Spirochaetota bacterium]HPP04107.1 hypothetical protein [Spirochaetota bacterium]
MITIFTIPKPFIDPHIKIIQTNAIKSWLLLKPTPEIILYGDDQGVGEIADELKIRHISNVKKNQFGTPLLNDIFEKTQEIANNEIICYVNCDIIFFQDVIETIKIAKNLKKYLLLGQRWDYDQKEFLDFSNDWQKQLKERVIKNGSLHPPFGSDYFIFKKGLLKNMPEFAVGRLGWDNWFIEYFIKNRIKVINCTDSIFIIHQNHDYSHKKVTDRLSENLEDSNNLKNLERIELPYSIDDVCYFIKNGKVVYKKTFKSLKNSLVRFLLKHKILFCIVRIINLPFKIIKNKFIKKERKKC